MRVLLFGPYPPPYGGVQVHAVSLRNYLLERDIPCAFINLDRHRAESADEIYYPESGFEVLRLLMRLDYDIAHLHVGGNLNRRNLFLGLLCSWLPSVKAVLTFHSGGYPNSAAGRSISPRTLRGFVLRQFDRTVGVNEEIVELFRRAGVPDRKIRLIAPHAMATPETDKLLAEDRATALGPRLDRFLGAHAPSLLTVGGLEPEYNLAFLIEALGAIRERFPDAGLVIIGSGSLEDELVRAIARQPHSDHVLLCGDVPHAQTLRVIFECDALLRTTSYDGDAISVREALHLGTPVLATDNGMRPDGVTLLPELEPGTLVDCTAAILDSPDAPATARFDDRNLQQVLELYEELIA